MSVFRLQEWWQTQLTSQLEEFDYGCMAIANIDNADPASDKVVCGSQDGVLRIYKPSSRQFRVEDLMLEESLAEPIIQLLTGLFLPGDEHIGLAILHPRKIAVYEVLPQRNNRDDRGSINFYKLHKYYEHSLGFEGRHFTAFNAIAGRFSGSERKDMLMVQSMDGKLQIFEQSAQAFVRQLSDCIFPTPIVYVPQLDAFVVTNSSCQAECYRYQVLASAQKDIGSRESKFNNNEMNNNSKSSSISKMRTALVEWSLNIGEPCIQIAHGFFSGSEFADKYGGEILILCEQSLFLLKASGAVIQQRKLDHKPSCMCIYPSANTNNTNTNKNNTLHNFIIGNHDCTIQVYSQFNLVWVAKVSVVPVQIELGTFGNNKGMIVVIDETGKVSVNYMGTKPPISSVVTHARELDYDKIDEEHRELMKIIKDSSQEKKIIEPMEKLIIRTQISRSFDSEITRGADLPTSSMISVQTLMLSAGLSFNDALQLHNNQQYIKICCRVYLSLTGSKSGDVTDAIVTISVPHFVCAYPKTINVGKLSSTKSTPAMVKIYLYALNSMLPSGLTAMITASYSSPSTGEPRAISHQFNLPLQLACRPKMATKTAIYKITLDTDKPPLPLTEIFGDFLLAYRDIGFDTGEVLGDTASKAIGFLFWSNEEVNNTSSSSSITSSKTSMKSSRNIPDSSSSSSSSFCLVSVIASKTTGRYRVQSDSLSAMYVVLSDLERRLLPELKKPTTTTTNDGNQEKKSNDSSESLSHSEYIVTCSDPFPLEEYFSTIHNHFLLRQNLDKLYSQLNDRSQQFRMIQKRLLVRYKDRNPSPLGTLDILLNETYTELITLGDATQEIQIKLNRVRNDLDCLSNLIVFLVKVKYQITKNEELLLRSFICPDFPETDDQGWEELVDVSMTYLLKTSLAKNVKETAVISASQLDKPTDMESLKKHISMVIDRISKGIKLIP